MISASPAAYAACTTITPCATIPINVAPAGALIASQRPGGGLSGNGTTVIGYYNGPADINRHGFRYSGGTSADLGTLGGNYSIAEGVNYDGSVVVGYSYTGSQYHAFRWTLSGAMADLGVMPGGTFSYAYAVNGDGSVIVGAGDHNGSSQHAFRWTSTDGFQDLGLLAGANVSYATGVDRSGSVVVGDAFGSASRPFRYTAASGMTELGFYPGGSYAFASGVSGDGQVAFGYGGGTGFNQHALSWSNGHVADLGTINGGYSIASAANNNGSVIVGESDSKAFRWTAVAGMKDLNVLLTDAGVSMTGISLASARGISDDGQFISGTGLFGSTQGVFLVRYDDGTNAGITTPGALQQSVTGLISTTTGVMAQQHGLAAPLLSDDKPITSNNHVGAFGYGGSASGGGFAQFANDAGLAVLMGVSYAQEDIDSAAMTDNVLVAGALRYVVPTGQVWRPFIEGGGWIAPKADLEFDRTYTNGVSTATGKGTTQGDLSYLFGRAGVLFDFGSRHQLSVSGEIGKERLDANGYAEATPGNPFNATIGAANDQMDIAKVRVIYNFGVTQKVDAALWAAGDFAFDRDIAVAANIAGGGSFSASALNGTSWAEFGGRVGYALTDSVTLDVFANGVAGDPNEIQTRVHTGADLRYQF